MLQCQKCFHELPDGTMFCDVCGTSLLSGAPAPKSDAASAGVFESYRVTPSQLPRTDMTPATPPRAFGNARGGMEQTRTDGGIRVATSRRIRLRLSNGKTFELTGKSDYLIGRRDHRLERQPDVDLTDWNGAAYGVSRQHAMIYVTEDGIWIEDLESLNETIRNEYRLMPRQRYPLEDGDELRLGSITLLVVLS
ncbi:MAG TPA: FHA domain-containing protein [Ktedonobacterales bacterium]|nr:FHA domain-containing protein [Ktedonobacterales bacterium]